MSGHPFGPDRWGLEAVLRQALYDLESKGGHTKLIVGNLRRALDTWDERTAEPSGGAGREDRPR